VPVAACEVNDPPSSSGTPPPPPPPKDSVPKEPPEVLLSVPPEPEVPKEVVDGATKELVEVLFVLVDEVDDVVEFVSVKLG
jgi:hypothetical protein